MIISFEEIRLSLGWNDLLNREIFTTLTEAEVLTADWRKEYNQFRPHSSLRYKPPAPEAKMLVTLTL
jgi:transposase InsO family protein